MVPNEQLEQCISKVIDPQCFTGIQLKTTQLSKR